MLSALAPERNPRAWRDGGYRISRWFERLLAELSSFGCVAWKSAFASERTSENDKTAVREMRFLSCRIMSRGALLL